MASRGRQVSLIAALFASSYLVHTNLIDILAPSPPSGQTIGCCLHYSSDAAQWTDSHSPYHVMDPGARIAFKLHLPSDVGVPDRFLSVKPYMCGSEKGPSPAIARGQDRAQLHRVDRDGPPYRPRGGLAGAAVRTGLRRDIALGREGGKPTRPGRVLLRREGLLAQLPVRGRTGTRRGGQRLLEGHGPHVRCEQEEGGGVRQGGPAEEAARGMEHGAIPVACGTGRYGGHARRRVRRCGSKDTTRVDVGSRRDEGAHRRGDQPRARKPRPPRAGESAQGAELRETRVGAARRRHTAQEACLGEAQVAPVCRSGLRRHAGPEGGRRGRVRLHAEPHIDRRHPLVHRNPRAALRRVDRLPARLRLQQRQQGNPKGPGN
ncbi:hypothetical protein THAOC_19185 [Thalassiosira oceanica]|uniref:FAD-binding FR-type domain-containing protein n=1 Tax=Thalassiosira oceanica TaxID=159749 RepID=K0SHH0_THAOC|nr:hypothetical protein THAOC_19185 [Thalassiosira oceanica]|eukprot:EJK60461.1 hypothetical protein THAOC_19185 [Thalassiosira oceanica]